MNTPPKCSAAHRTVARVATSSAGLITVNPGSAHASARSSIDICDGPSSPIEIPLCVPTTFTFTRGYATVVRNCSKPLFITKQENELTNGILPVIASPAPSATMLASAIPHSKNRVGNSFAKYVIIVDFDRSASQLTTFGFSRATSTSARPKASRVAAPSFNS